MCSMTWIGCVRLVRHLKCDKIVGPCKMSAIKLSMRHLSTERKCSLYVIILIWLSPNCLLCHLINIHKPGWQAIRFVLYFLIIPMIPDSCEPSMVAHHSEFSKFWITDGWMDGWMLHLLELYSVNSSSCHSNSASPGVWPFQIPIHKLKGSHIFNSEFCTFLTWCKATSLPTTLQPRIQLLQMMIRCCLWLRLADIAKSHPKKMYWPRWNSWQGAERIP